jgi:hypothetical protein
MKNRENHTEAATVSSCSNRVLTRIPASVLVSAWYSSL